MGRIPEETLQAIRDRTDLVELVGRHVALKKAGRSYKGLCPFHHEKTPSFQVNPDRGIFHCFGCGESGNAFAFLIRVEGLSFPEAVRTLAASPEQTVPFLRERLHPGENPLSEARLTRLIADLDSRQFATREAAAKELTAAGRWAAPALRRALESDPTLEARRRLEPLLEQVEGLRKPSERLRTIRALEALELIGAPARGVFEMLQRTAPEVNCHWGYAWAVEADSETSATPSIAGRSERAMVEKRIVVLNCCRIRPRPLPRSSLLPRRHRHLRRRDRPRRPRGSTARSA